MNLKQLIQEAWGSSVADYHQGLINSECTLQSAFYGELRRRGPNLIILCEPQLLVDGHGCCAPDLIVVSSGSIAAIVEIKFVPHGYPAYEIDLKKLKVIAECGQRFQIMLDPKSGQFLADRFGISPSCVLVFAAIAKHDAVAVDAGKLRQAMAASRFDFLPLTGPVPETVKGQ